MSTSKFADVHNLVVFLSKPTESEGFEQIVDFLNANPIKPRTSREKHRYTPRWMERRLLSMKQQLGEILSLKMKEELIACQMKSSLNNFHSWDGMSKHNAIYVIPSHTNKVFGNMKRVGKDFSGRDTPLFPTIMVQLKKNKPRRQDTEETHPSGPGDNVADEALNAKNVPTHSNDPLLRGEDSIQVKELKDICTNLQKRVLDLETTKENQAM
nr:hypothetical protein [Tanacetum cinerariifolium]